jgi:hypothetical protein
MAALPGVLGCSFGLAQDKLTLRRTVQVRLGTNPAVPRDGWKVARPPIFAVSLQQFMKYLGWSRWDNCDHITMKSIGINIAAVLSHAPSFLFAGIPVSKAQYLWQQCLVMFYKKK